MALCAIELIDIVFAVDSVPAALAIGVIVACIGAAVWPSVRALRREARALRQLVAAPR